ncbi:MAG: hypothetical protein IIY12_01215, partial [Clostridia bacterium]|nr:hypothetical protein [Clostridia bacterium]
TTLRIIGSGYSYGALIGMILFLFNTPAESVFLQTLKILLVAAICAAVSGTVITGILFLLEHFRSKAYDPCRQELKAEGEMILEDAVKRLVSDKMVKGWLFLTPSSLTFYDGAKQASKIAVSEIESVQIIDPKAGNISVATVAGASEVFSVGDALAWFNAIGDLKNE